MRRAGVMALALLCGCASVTWAQAKTGPRLEVSAGALFVGGYAGGEQNADLTANQSGGGAYTLFKTKSRIESAPGIEARLGFRLSPMFTIEGGVFTSRPQLSTRVTADLEGAPDATVAEDLSVYVIDAALMVTFGAKPGARVTPFVRAGAGYVRELHQDNALVKTGQAFHAGGGVTTWFDRRQAIGLRADVRVHFISGGIDLDGGTRTQAAGGASVVFAF